MVDSAILLALGALVLYGGWAVAAGLATRSLSPANAVVLSYVASLVVAGGYALGSRGPLTGTRTDVVAALASGAFLALGTVSFYAGLARGNAAVVSAIAALYFVVSAVVGVLYLDVQLGPANVAGLALAVAGAVLVAS